MLKTKPGTCGATLAACDCVHETDHKGPHECNCGGSWNHDGSTVSLPKVGLGNDLGACLTLLDAMLGARPDDEVPYDDN